MIKFVSNLWAFMFNININCQKLLINEFHRVHVIFVQRVFPVAFEKMNTNRKMTKQNSIKFG